MTHIIHHTEVESRQPVEAKFDGGDPPYERGSVLTLQLERIPGTCGLKGRLKGESRTVEVTVINHLNGHLSKLLSLNEGGMALCEVRVEEVSTRLRIEEPVPRFVRVEAHIIKCLEVTRRSAKTSAQSPVRHVKNGQFFQPSSGRSGRSSRRLIKGNRKKVGVSGSAVAN